MKPQHTPSEQQLLELARSWIELDPDENNRQILRDEIAAADFDTLASRFAGPLNFGTAGLRAAEGPGVARMNRVVVRRTAAGLADWGQDFLSQTSDSENAAPLHVVIGFDARTGSADFARDSAAVFTAAGCRVQLMAEHAPTPLLAYAVRALKADLGIMVTASHNPATDNGYKVYVGGRLTAQTDPHGTGSQITSPVDEQIAGYIDRWYQSANEPTLAESGWAPLDPHQLFEDYSDHVIERLNELAPVTQLPEGADRLQTRRMLSVVYTAMHGVGGEPFMRLMERAGFAAPVPVSEQFAPDPKFPTVNFPNPEEPGALDLAIATANRQTTEGSSPDLIIAHDPDADRLAVAVPVTGTDSKTGWRMLTGDEVGLLLGSYLGQALPQNQSLIFANSVVSGSALARWVIQFNVTRAADGLPAIRFARTLTGFKWISRVPGLSYGYEEALGYCVFPDMVHDKDGLSAAAVLCQFAAELKSRTDDGPRTLSEELTRISQQLGATLTTQISVRIPDPEQLGELMHKVRSVIPETLVGLPVTETIDYLDPDQAAGVGVGTTNLLQIEAQQAGPEPRGARLMVRPSGTEPKIKCYLETHAPSDSEAAELMDRLSTQAQQLLG